MMNLESDKMHPTAQILLHRLISMGFLDLNIQAMVLSQCHVESGGFLKLEENLHYSAQGLMATWPRRFDPIYALKYANKPEQIANRAYSNRLGNGVEESGDGWKYRGRGIIQLTGKENYATCGRALNMNLVANPDLLTDPDTAVCSAVWFLFQRLRDFEGYAKAADVSKCTLAINGGYTGLPARKAKFIEYLRILTQERK